MSSQASNRDHYRTRLFFSLLKLALALLKSKSWSAGPWILINRVLFRFSDFRELRKDVLVSFRTEKPLSQSAVVTAVITSEEAISMIFKSWP